MPREAETRAVWAQLRTAPGRAGLRCLWPVILPYELPQGLLGLGIRPGRVPRELPSLGVGAGPHFWLSSPTSLPQVLPGPLC